jgi:hypothetical protein
MHFYFSINAGSMLSILLIPYLNKHYGPMVAFGVPAIAMLIAVFFFWLGRSKYRRIPPPKFDPNKLVIFLTAFVSLIASYLYWDTIPSLIKQTVEQGGSSSLTALYPFWEAKEISTAGTGTVLMCWLVLVVILTFIFKRQWFAKPGNFVGINFFALTNGGFSAAAKEYGDETVEGIKSVWARAFGVCICTGILGVVGPKPIRMGGTGYPDGFEMAGYQLASGTDFICERCVHFGIHPLVLLWRVPAPEYDRAQGYPAS